MEQINGVTDIVKHIIKDILVITFFFLIIALFFEFFWEKDLITLHNYLNDFFFSKLDMTTRNYYRDVFNVVSMVVNKILCVLLICIVFLTCIKAGGPTFNFYFKKTLSAIIGFSSFDILFNSFLNIIYKCCFLPDISDVFENIMNYISYWIFFCLFIALVCVVYSESNNIYCTVNHERPKSNFNNKIEDRNY